MVPGRVWYGRGVAMCCAGREAGCRGGKVMLGKVWLRNGRVPRCLVLAEPGCVLHRKVFTWWEAIKQNAKLKNTLAVFGLFKKTLFSTIQKTKSFLSSDITFAILKNQNVR